MSIKGLEEIEVSFVDPDTGHPDSGFLGDREHIHVYDATVESTRMSPNGTGNILTNLPNDMLEKVKI